MGVLAAFCLLTVFVCVSLGSVRIPLAQVWLAMTGLLPGVEWRAEPVWETIILQVRLPRVLLAALVGAGLGVSGAVLQGLFRNPMADPGLIGVSSGAALGAVAALSAGLGAFSPWAVPGAAFAGGTLVVLVVYEVARVGGRTPLSTLLLAGLAVSSLCGAAVSLILTLSEEFVLRELIFWLMGSLHGKGWQHAAVAAAPIALGAAALSGFGRELNLLLSGEAEAKAMGVPVERTKGALLLLSSFVTGVAVSMSGVVSFVGLMVPHLVRLGWGADHRLLTPASALAGAAFLMLADLVARTAVRPAELQLGVVTAFVGVPFFLYLLRKRRREVLPF